MSLHWARTRPCCAESSCLDTSYWVTVDYSNCIARPGFVTATPVHACKVPTYFAPRLPLTMRCLRELTMLGQATMAWQTSSQKAAQLLTTSVASSWTPKSGLHMRATMSRRPPSLCTIAAQLAAFLNASSDKALHALHLFVVVKQLRVCVSVLS